MQTNETAIRNVVEQVLAQLGKRPAPGPAPQPKANGIPVVSASNGHGYRPGGGGNWASSRPSTKPSQLRPKRSIS